MIAGLVADGLAVFRVTRAVTTDTFPLLLRAREAVLRRFGPDSAVSELVTCPHCVSVWVALGLAVLRSVAPRSAAVAVRAVAVAAVAGFLAQLDARGES